MHKKRKKNARVLSLSLLSAQSARAMRQERAAGSERGESLKKNRSVCARVKITTTTTGRFKKS